MKDKIKSAISEEFFDMAAWADKKINSSTYWTSRVTSALEKANSDGNLELRYSQRKSGETDNWEFLFDFVLLDTGKHTVDNGYFTGDYLIKRVVAIVESEFQPNSNEILYDFSKLLLGKAELKVMIFYHKSDLDSQNVISEMQRMVSTCTQSAADESYLISWFCHASFGFEFVELSGKGKIIRNN